MALSTEEITQIANVSAQRVLEGLHRFAVEYKEPATIEQGLRDSMVEEKTAADWYRRRAAHAKFVRVAGHIEPTVPLLYEHIAKEEDRHYRQLEEALRFVERGEGPVEKRKFTRGQVKVTVWEERDRLHIGIVDKKTEQVSIADWWDDDARQMFEDGFFSHKHGLDNSVLEYAEDMGFLAK